MGKILKAFHLEGTKLEKVPEAKGRKLAATVHIARFEDGHTHFVFPKGDEAMSMIFDAAEELDIDLPVFDPVEEGETGSTEVKIPRRIVLRNRQAIGDILMFTCLVRDLKKAHPEVEIKVESTAMHIWDYNPHLCTAEWPEVLDARSLKTDGEPSDAEMAGLNKQAVKIALQEDRPVKVYVGPSKGTNASNRSDNHFCNAYRTGLEMMLGVQIPQGPIRPDIYMIQSEYDRPPIIKPPYWLITAGEKGDWTCKTYPFAFWKKVVEDMPTMTFVQIGEDVHKHPDLTSKNVINYIGKTSDGNTGIRDLFNLFNYCEGSMGLVSFQAHLAAAFNKPAVVIAGAREPVWFTRYPGQQYLATDGCLPCTIDANGAPTACWHCKIEVCKYHTKYDEQKVPNCAALIKHFEVSNAIAKYYVGGRLDKNKPAGRSKLVKVVKDYQMGHPPAPLLKPTAEQSNMWGFAFGGSSITDKDWAYISDILSEYKVKTLLEFGSGLSTLLISAMGIEVVSFECRDSDIQRVKAMNPNAKVIKWDGKKSIKEAFKKEMKFDAALIDGPAGGENREPSFKDAVQLSDLIFVHDGGRAPEKKWQEQYLSKEFKRVSQGGHRTVFWQRKEEVEIIKVVDPLALATDQKIEVGEWTNEVPGIKVEDATKTIIAPLVPEALPAPIIQEPLPPVEKTDLKVHVVQSAKSLFRMVFNGRSEGGAERSTTYLMNQFIRGGWDVEYVAPLDKPSTWFQNNGHKDVKFINDMSILQTPCEVMVLYANDWCWELKKPQVGKLFANLQAKRKVIVVNYKLDKIGSKYAKWTRGWDKYLFLNSSLKKALLAVHMGANTEVLAPPTELDKFYFNQPKYDGTLKIVRHASQGDAKYPKDFNEKLAQVLNAIPDCEVYLMPPPSFLKIPASCNGRVYVHQRNVPPVDEFLAQGNVYWYCLPDKYTEGGPKAIMEAQASGLAVVADNHSGPADRVVEGTGILAKDFDDHIASLKHFSTNSQDRETFGEAAREHAQKEYRPLKWINSILK